jgi:hypothetical protein
MAASAIAIRNMKCAPLIEGEERAVGWTNDPTGGSLVTMVEEHPSWHSPRVSKSSKEL